MAGGASWQFPMQRGSACNLPQGGLCVFNFLPPEKYRRQASLRRKDSQKTQLAFEGRVGRWGRSRLPLSTQPA